MKHGHVQAAHDEKYISDLHDQNIFPKVLVLKADRQIEKKTDRGIT